MNIRSALVTLLFGAFVVQTAQAAPPDPGYIYRDAFTAGWSYAADHPTTTPTTLITPTSTAEHYWEYKSIKVTAQQANDSLYLYSSSGIATDGNESIGFAVHGGATGGQSLHVTVYDGTAWSSWREVTDYIDGGTIEADTWHYVTVPLTDLGNPATIHGWYIRSTSASTFYVDDIALVTLHAVYRDTVIPRWSDGYYAMNGTMPTWVDYQSTAKVHQGSRAIQVNAGADDGLYLTDVFGGVSTNAMRDLSFAFYHDSGGTDLYAFVYDGTSWSGAVALKDYTGGSITTGTWYEVTVPLEDFGSPAALYGIFIMTNDADAFYYVDDVRLFGLKFPLAGETPYTAELSAVMDHSAPAYNCANNTVTAFSGEVGNVSPSTWGTPGLGSCTAHVLRGYTQTSGLPFTLGSANYTGGGDDDYLFYDGHAGADYPGTTTTKVYAAEAGVVTNNQCSSISCVDYGQVEITHNNGYQTHYLHLDRTSATIDDDTGIEVYAGQHIGYIGDTGSGENHLHFTVKKANGAALTRVDPYGWEGTAGQDPAPVPLLDGTTNNTDNRCLWRVCN